MRAGTRSPVAIAAILLALGLASHATGAAARAAAKPAHPGAGVPVHSALAGLEFLQLDVPHSSIEFSVAWMGLSKVHGSFDDCVGTIVLDTTDFTRSSVSIVARTPSLHTGSAQRDKDLKGADWFDVEHFPTAVFQSTAIVREGDGYRMRGSLTIHGVTRDVEFPFSYAGRLVRASHEVRVGCEGRLALRRQDFGLGGPARFNVLTEMGKAMISDDIELPLAIEGWRAGRRDTLPDPATDSLARRVSTAGFAVAAREYREVRARTADSLMVVNEAVLNTLGYAYLDWEKPAEAIQTFALEAESYPHSAFPLVGLTQAYATLGDREHAIESAGRALALNPNATRATEILRRLRSPAP